VKRTSSNGRPRSLALNLWPLEFGDFFPYEQEKDFATWEFAVFQCEQRRRFMASGKFLALPTDKIRVGRVSGWSRLIPFLSQRGSQRGITAAPKKEFKPSALTHNHGSQKPENRF